MTIASRRSFLKGLGALGAGLIVAPVIEPLIVERKKIWVVGAQLERVPTEIWAVGARIPLKTEWVLDAIASVVRLQRSLVRGEITVLPGDDPNSRLIGLGIEVEQPPWVKL